MVLTLQKSFAYEGAGSTSVDEVDIGLQFPRYATLTLGEGTNITLVDTGPGSLSFHQKLTDKEYYTIVHTSDIFGDAYGDTVYGYIKSLTDNYQKPAIANLSIPLKVSFDRSNANQVSLDSIFFLKFKSYTAPSVPQIPKVAPDDQRIISGPVFNGVSKGALRVVEPATAVTLPDGPIFRPGGGVTLPDIKTDALVNASIYMVNKQAYYNVLKELFPGGLKVENESVLLYLINQLIDLSGASPRITQGGDGQRESLDQVIAQFGLPKAPAFDILVKRWDSLFDWPLKMGNINSLTLAGTMHISAPQDYEVTMKHFYYYHFSAEFLKVSAREVIVPHVSKFDWDPNSPVEKGTIKFEFRETVLRSNISPPVHIRVVGFDGSDQYAANFDPSDPDLQNLNITVNLNVPPILDSGAIEGATGLGGKKIKGKLVSLSKPCTLKGSVVLQAKATEAGEWKVVSSGLSDKAGNFALPYPYGNYVAAKASVSLDPESITTIPTQPNAPNAESISDAFLYVLINPSKDKASDDDCNCNSTTVADRLPSQDELIQSNQFTQDLGGGCMNLSTPNRTLREYTYNALVRTSDPDVANYTLSATSEWINSEEVVTYQLNGNGKFKRSTIDLDNAVQWQDVDEASLDTSLYQAVTVSVGHVLTYKSEFRADGYSLGNLLHSLPLAPGQKKQIVTIDSTHSLRGTEDQSLTASERLANSLLSEREVVDDIAGNIGEVIQGRSDANTSGFSAAAGAAGSYGAGGAGVGASAAMAGGTANANSTASQNSSRALSGHFDEQIKQRVNQNASSYRQQNSSVVTTVQEGQKYGAETTVVANHNHCHTITIMHWEVLRHFAVYQELVDVEECVFIPFPLTRFTVTNVAKWADILVSFLKPLHSNTFFRPNAFFGTAPRHPLVPAFDAAERVRTNWALVDYPTAAYDTEPIQFIQGEMTVTVDIPRPQTKYDNIRSLPLIMKPEEVKGGALGHIANFLWGGGSKEPEHEVRQQIFDAFMTLDANYSSVPPARCIRIRSFTPFSMFGLSTDPASFFNNSPNEYALWGKYAALLGHGTGLEGVRAMAEFYFKDALISEWDSIWNSQAAPIIYRMMKEAISLDSASLDKTDLTKYNGGERTVNVAVSGTYPSARKDITKIALSVTGDKVKALINTAVVFTLRRLRISYSTQHYNGMLFNGAVNNDLLDGATVPAPENASERRSPRTDDRLLTKKLLTHLNTNLEYYNRVLLYSMDEQRRFMLLDGFTIQVYKDDGTPNGYRSLSSVLKHSLISVIGNAMVFPVSPGFKVNQNLIVATTTDQGEASNSLLDLYKPDMPSPPYRLSVPSRGVYSESIIGQCDSCEKVKPDSSQDWVKFTTDEPTAINAISPPVPTITNYKPETKDFAAPMINLQNAPTMPNPGAGLQGVTELLGKAGIFQDVTGLSGNQQNAMATYQSNQQQVKAFAEMATNLASQAHNTANAAQIMDTIGSAQKAGIFTKEEAAALAKKHIETQIDGGQGQKEKAEKEKAQESGKKPAPADSTKEAMDKFSNVKSETTENADGSKTSKIEASGPKGSTVKLKAKVQPEVNPLQQAATEQTCWAVVATMMVNWATDRRMLPKEALAAAGEKYVEKFKKGESLKSYEKNDLIEALDMVAEATGNNTIQSYTKWVNDFGPVWITVDSRLEQGVFSPHAKILVQIDGDEDPTGANTSFTFVDPFTGKKEAPQKFSEFLKGYEQMVTDNPTENLFIQVVHFKNKAKPPGEGSGVQAKWHGLFTIYGTPVHENLTLAALYKAKYDKLKAGTTFENADGEIKEFIRGAVWNDDPACLFFKQDRTDNYHFSGLTTWGEQFGQAKLFSKVGINQKSNLTGRSHFNDLQFLHAMSTTVKEPPGDTLAMIMTWLEVMYKVAQNPVAMQEQALNQFSVSNSSNDVGQSSKGSGKTYNFATFFGPNTTPLGSESMRKLLTANERPAEPDPLVYPGKPAGSQSNYPASGDKLYVPNDQFKGLMMDRRAIGCMMHCIQDSFAKGHTARTVDPTTKRHTTVENFHCYAGQNEDKHGEYDQYAEKLVPWDVETFRPVYGAVDAIEACAKLVELWVKGSDWGSVVKPFFLNEVFPIAGNATSSNTDV